MKILLVNAFHYLRGGVERTYLDESRWLSAAGHEVAHFAIRDPRNLPSPTARYFAPAADFGEAVAASRQLAQLPRMMWSRPAARAMSDLLSEFRPEVAHLHAPSRYLTPSFLRPLERAGVPVVMTLHDFKPWCTNRIMLAHGAPCERCRGGRHWRALATGCVQDSRLKSSVAMVEAYLHDALHAWGSVRRWIAPSRFVHAKAVEWGIAPGSLRLLYHGVEAAAARAGAAIETAGRTATGIGTAAPPGPGAEVPAGAFVLFAGRLSVEKGVRLLPEIAARIAPTPLLVAGEGPLRGWLEREAPASLRLLGHLSDADLARLRAAAAVVLVPSVFYEHFGYTPAEALLERRPVVAARVGALPELIEHERTGLLAAAGDAEALAAATRRALGDPGASGWGEAGRARVLEIADPGRHLEGLLAIYREVIDPDRATPSATAASRAVERAGP